MEKKTRASKAEIKSLHPVIKEMYESGAAVKDIATSLGISKEAIYNAITVMKIQLRRKKIVEPEIEALMYADNTPPVLEKIVFKSGWRVKNGVKQRTKNTYTDVTPIFSPR